MSIGKNLRNPIDVLTLSESEKLVMVELIVMEGIEIESLTFRQMFRLCDRARRLHAGIDA